MCLQHITGNIYADVSGKYGGNFGAVVLQDQVVMIDSGMIHTHTAKVRDWIDSQFLLPVTKLLYTHSHSDHVFGAQGLGELTRIGSKAMSDICIRNLDDQWKSETILSNAESRKEERPELWAAVQNLTLKLPDLVFEKRITIGAFEELTLQHIGGHTAGSSVVISKDEHAIFIGDLIFNGVFPYAGDPTCNPDVWISALEEIGASNFDYIIPGHGPLCDNEALQSHIEFFQKLRESVKDAINAGISADEYLNRNMMPEYYEEGLSHRGPITIHRFFDFYS
ncbi:MAG: MBL fold metallo-hydrolase [Candidatus Thorarchaeota archaeon]